jgi:hypothetical protein
VTSTTVVARFETHLIVAIVAVDDIALGLCGNRLVPLRSERNARGEGVLADGGSSVVESAIARVLECPPSVAFVTNKELIERHGMRLGADDSPEGAKLRRERNMC